MRIHILFVEVVTAGGTVTSPVGFFSSEGALRPEQEKVHEALRIAQMATLVLQGPDGPRPLPLTVLELLGLLGIAHLNVKTAQAEVGGMVQEAPSGRILLTGRQN